MDRCQVFCTTKYKSQKTKPAVTTKQEVAIGYVDVFNAFCDVLENNDLPNEKDM